MCGITGLIDGSGSGRTDTLEPHVAAMAAQLIHRGPDDDGVWSDPSNGVALGFRRLAILDLSEAGAQPMTSADGRYTIVHNGEVYNFPEIRDGLEDRGHTFRGRSDTEVIVEAISEWGLEGALERFIGMFAFAVWDGEKRRLHLVRDRIGEKPLFYGRVGDVFVFASELKSLHEHPDFDAEVDRDALAAYLRHGYVPTPMSIYEDVAKLPPGTYLTVDVDGEVDGPTRYWSARDVAERGQRDPLRGSEEALADRLEETLRDAVGRCLAADVPLGVFLSGGLDSSIVTALAQAESEEPVRSFTIGFWDETYDESDHARAVADHLETDHTELYAEPSDALDVIPGLPAMYDEPFADSSQVPTHLVARLARDHVTVALSGDGGDELFGGYTRHFIEQRIFQRTDAIPRPLRRGVSALMRVPSPRQWDRLDGLLGAAADRYGAGGTLGSRVHKGAELLAADGPADRYARMTSIWDRPGDVVRDADGADGTSSITDRSRWADLDVFTHQMMYLDLVTYLPDDIFTKVDRASMGVSLESRAPLVNHDVVEFAWRLPLRMKVRDGRGKHLLRRVLHRHVPKKLVDRPKSGFSVPIDRWLREDLRPWARDLLVPDLLRRQGFLDPEAVREAWEAHQSGRANRHHELWTILMFQAWMKEHHPERW